MMTCSTVSLRFRMLLGAACLMAGLLHAADYELRLVPFDDPDADLAARVEAENARWGEGTNAVMPHACWARNIRLNGQPLFEIYEQGRYIDRLPVARPKIGPGSHTLWPGQHAFTIAEDGSVTTESPELLIDTATLEDGRTRHRIRLKAYPLTVRAFDADARREPSALLDHTPLPDLTLREAGNHLGVFGTPDSPREKPDSILLRDLLPVQRRFLWLTAWVPANTQGQGYLLYPQWHTFHLDADGLRPGAGDGTAISGWRHEGHELSIPTRRIPISGAHGTEDHHLEVVIPDMQRITFREDIISAWADTLETRFYANLYQREAPYHLRFSSIGPGLLLDGNLDDLPVKHVHTDWHDDERLHQRGLLVELETRHLDADVPVRARLRAVAPAGAMRARDVADAAAERLKEARSVASQAERQVASRRQALEAARKANEPVPEASRQLEDAEAELATATERVEDEKTAAEEAERAAVAALEDNPLANGTPIIQWRALGQHDWQVAPHRRLEGQEIEFSIPASAPPGVYEFKLGLRPDREDQREITLRMHMTLAPPDSNGIGLFTMRGRTAFYRGESFTVALGILAPAQPVEEGTPVTIEIAAAGREPLILYEGAIDRTVVERDTLLFTVGGATSMALAPGAYELRARVGKWVTPPRVAHIVSPAPATHFTNLLLGKYNQYRNEYETVLFGRHIHDDPHEVARAIAGTGYNAFKGMTYRMEGRSAFTVGGELPDLVRERPALGPAEAFARPTGRDQFLDGMVRYNLAFYENLFAYNDSIIPRGEAMLRGCERYALMESQSMLHSPAFRGVNLYDEFSHSLDHNSPAAFLAYVRQADDLTYRQRYGRSPSDAQRALNRFVGRPDGQRDYEDLDIFLSWKRHEDYVWEQFSARMSGAVKGVMPESFNFTLARTAADPGSTIQTGPGSREGIFRPLDAAGAVGYKDMGGYGTPAVTGPLVTQALRNRPDLRVWPMVSGYGMGTHDAAVMRHLFFTLGQGPDGISWFHFPDALAPNPGDSFSVMRDMAGTLTTRYGDFLLATKPGYREVAILYSRDADLLAVRKSISPSMQCESLWTACMRAGFPARILTESQLLAGAGKDFQAIFVPGFTFPEEISADLLDTLRQLQAAGKTLIVGRQSRLPLPDLLRLDSDLDDLNDRAGGSFPKYLDADDEKWWGLSEELTGLVHDTLTNRVPPAAVHDRLVGPDWLRVGQGEYLVMPNLAFTGFTGNHKTLQAAPDMPVIRFPARPPAVYNMLEMQRAEALQVDPKDGAMTLTLDFRNVPGAIYAFLPAPIGGVSLRTPPRVRAGEALPYGVTVVDGAGTVIDAGFPLEITVLDAEDRKLLQIWRAAKPAFEDRYVVPVNLPPGLLRLRVRELIGGHVAEAAIEVTPGALTPAVRDRQAVRKHQAGQLAEFIRNAPPPIRMQPGDIRLPADFVRLLRAQTTPLLAALRARLAPATLALVDALGDDGQASPELIEALVGDLNQVILGAPLYGVPGLFPAGKLRVETARLAQETTDPALVPDVNRLLIEESFPSELVARPALLIEVESEWVRPAAKRLRDALLARGLRARGTSLRPYVRTPVSQMVTVDQTMNIDGFRLWRGDLVRPGVIVDAPLVLLGGERGLIPDLVATDLLPEPISDNIPGRGRAILSWVRQPFSLDFDTVAVLANDAEGLMAGVEALLAPDAPATVVDRWQPGREAPAATADQPAKVETVGRATDIERFSDQVGYRDRVETLAVDSESGRIAIGTDGHGHNLFCFSAGGELQWKTFLPEHGVYSLSWIDEGRRIVAATGHGWWLFIIDPADGHVTSRVSLTEWPDFQVKDRPTRTHVKIVDNAPLRQLLVLGRTGIQAIDYDGNLIWFHDRAFEVVRYPQEADQVSFAVFGEYLKILDVACSPDGSRLIYNEQRSFASTSYMMATIPLWRNEPQILDARTGAVLLHNTEDPGANDPWSVSWPGNDQEDPVVHTQTLSARLSFSGEPPADGPDPGRLGSFLPPDPGRLAAGTRLTKTYRDAQLSDAHDLPIWQRLDHEHYLIALDRLNVAQTRLYRISREGIVRCIDVQSGATIWEHDLGLWARLEPLPGDELLAGGRGGLITRFGADGQMLWQTRLGKLHEPPAGDYPGYIAAAVARDEAVQRQTFPRAVDAPDDYEGILRMGLEQLDNGDFADDQGWTTQTGDVVIDDAAAHTGSRSLRVADGQLVTSRVQRRVVRGATYLLEFRYRPEQAGAILAAGTALLGDETVLTVSNFQDGPGAWHFGRVAIKAHLDTVDIDVGFEASGGAVRVDGVSLRPIRFPSANLLANEDLHRIEPTHAESFRIQYERLPQGMRESLMRRNNVSAFLQETPLGALIFLEDPAFLQNGRIDDVGSMWCYRHEQIGFAVTLTQPAHVSHLVIYLNNTAPELAYPFITIQANDLEIKVPETVALVRGNKRRFIVVHFPKTIHTDHFKILPGRYPSRHDAITEIEVYGPVGGPEMMVDKRFTDDPLAVPMLMGNPAHVIAQPGPDRVGTYRAETLMNVHQAASYRSGVTVADSFMSFAYASGSIERVPVNDAARLALDAAVKEAGRQGRPLPPRQWGLASVTPLGTPARYAGRLLVGSADYRMHAVADNGTRIWNFPTEGRVYSSPTPAGDEVFFGSDDGILYKVDVDSGILVWEFKTGGRVRSAPALDDKNVYVASWDGLLYAVDRELGRTVWTAPLAPDTSAAPALHGGRVYIGDEDGALHCLDAATGAAVWQVALGGPMPKGISTVPVITESGVLVVTDGGQAARVGFDGQTIWNRDLMADRRAVPVPPMLNNQPYPTRSQLLVPMNQGLLVLRQEDGLPDERFVPPADGGNVLSAVPYGDRIVVIREQTQVQGVWTRFIVNNAADAMVWLPVKEDENP